VHPGEDSDADLCVHCGTRLDGASSQYPQALFRQPTVRAQRWTRITSEEERVREGYLTTTHFRTSGGAREERTFIEPQTGGAILSARARQAAQQIGRPRRRVQQFSLVAQALHSATSAKASAGLA